MKVKNLVLALGIAGLGVLQQAVAASAITFNVNRTWTNDSTGSVASLIGTVDIPEGYYTITKGGASPFTNVNLNLNIDGSSSLLNATFTQLIQGTAEFIINATSSTLTFNVNNADGNNPGDLIFFDNISLSGLYIIGRDGSPGFERGRLSNNSTALSSLSFPVTFGTAQSNVVPVPEPSSTLGLFVLGAIGAGATLKRKQQKAAIKA